MTLSRLSAIELARIDSVCLEFESQIRAGEEPSIDEIVDYHGGEHADLLRQELGTIKQELLADSNLGSTASGDSKTIVTPFGTDLPALSKRSQQNLPSQFWNTTGALSG